MLYRSRYCNGAGVVVANRQPVLAHLFNFDCLVNAAIGAVNFMKYAIRINITEINTGGLGRVDAVISNTFALVQKKFSGKIDYFICGNAVVQLSGYARYAWGSVRENRRTGRNSRATNSKDTGQQYTPKPSQNVHLLSFSYSRGSSGI